MYDNKTMKTNDNILTSLNPAQLAAVTSEARNLLVLAGAGSGKTRVLVHRIAWLIQHQQVPPSSILAVTFTNKAANEMRERVEQLLGGTLHGMWIGTFHSLAHRLLRMHWQLAGLPEGFQILDADDQQRIIKRIMRERGIDEETLPPKDVQWFINNKKDQGLRPEQVKDAYYPDVRAKLELYFIYENTCQSSGLIDFAELLLRAYELWLKNPELLAQYQQRFTNILVDEFQDTNVVQYSWLRLLAGQHGKITIVGDDDQSIYGWRGACADNIHKFQTDFVNPQIVRLEQNYRSKGVILRAANALISHNYGRLGKNLWTDSGDGEPIGLYHAFNERDEARFVLNQIMKLTDQGYAFKDIGILYRSNAQSRVFEEALVSANLAYQVYGGMRFFERAEIKNALAYLRLLEHQNNDAAFERIVNFPTRGIGDRSIEQIRQMAHDAGTSLWEMAERVVAGNMVSTNVISDETAALTSPRTTKALANFLKLIKDIAIAIQNLALPEQIKYVINASGLVAHYTKEEQASKDKAAVRLENLEELENAAQQFMVDDGASSLAEFLAYATLNAGEDANADGNGVQLMTLHSAKGLEFPVVFLVGMEEGLFPHQMSLLSDGSRLEEERRLCYVGITRAMQKLYLSYADARYLHGRETRQRVSRFIKEIPADCLQDISLRVKVSPTITSGSKSFTPPKMIKTESSAGNFTIGQRVQHDIFGEGVILNFEGGDASPRVQVNFKTAGTKWLALNFAKLKTL